MIRLVPGYNAVRWTDAPQLISSLEWLPLLARAYAHNQSTNAGYIGYTKGDLYPNLTQFEPGQEYLLDMLGTYDLAAATLASPSTFAAFPGYAPVAAPTQTPVATGTPGSINTSIAAVSIRGGQLVARVAAGLVPYSTDTLQYRYQLFGFALNSARPGGTVQVQRNGVIEFPGLDLVPNATLLAGPDGQLVYSHEGLALHHVVGRAISAASLTFSSSFSCFST